MMNLCVYLWLPTMVYFFRLSLADVCYIGQEKEGTSYEWVLDASDPCECTEIRLGGVNTIPPASRPAKARYMEDLVLGDDLQQIREWLDCPEMTTVETEMMPTLEGTTSVLLCDEVMFTVKHDGQPTSYLTASPNEQSVWVLDFSLSMNAYGIVYLARAIKRKEEDMFEIIIQNYIEVRDPSGDQVIPPVAVTIGTARHTLTIGDGELKLDRAVLSTTPELNITELSFVKFDCVQGVDCVWTLHGVPCSWKSN